MSLDGADFIDNLLDEQARLNSMADDGDVANLVADFQTIAGELVGFITEVLTTTGTNPPHNWNQGANTLYGFFSWA